MRAHRLLYPAQIQPDICILWEELKGFSESICRFFRLLVHDTRVCQGLVQFAFIRSDPNGAAKQVDGLSQPTGTSEQGCKSLEILW